MTRLFLISIFLFVLQGAHAQLLKVSGMIHDTVSNRPLKDAVVLAVRLSDSVLVSFTRSDAEGFFDLPPTPADTYEVVIRHPLFSELSLILVGSPEKYDFQLGKVILPPKSYDIKEVVILGYQDPVYFRGDTLVYAADSFNVQQNATVEDLLKKLPGIEVDKQGNIRSQGKEVTQVLVDGDEFFGSDPTMATRNLQADNIKSVEVYEKKDDKAGGNAAGNETVTVMDLKLKEEAKKGYFGKVSGGSDLRKFYEGELLTNRFSNKRKLSVFALVSNTPKSSFGFGDSYRFGIENENMTINNDEEGISYYFYNQNPEGYPRTQKAGFYFTDQVTEKLKATANYTFSDNFLEVQNETRTQYFLEDTTYSTLNSRRANQDNRANLFNLKLAHKLDSLTTLDFEPRYKETAGHNATYTANEFFTAEGVSTRATFIENVSENRNKQFTSSLGINRKFSKPERAAGIKYLLTLNNQDNNGTLKTRNTFRFSDSTSVDSLMDQQRTTDLEERSHKLVANYTEPLSKKFKIMLGYDLQLSNLKQGREVLNAINGDYIFRDSVLSNRFESDRTVHLLSSGLVYETKKTRISMGAKYRDNKISNRNIFTDQLILQSVQNLLPQASYRYKFSDNKALNFNYRTNSTLPSINQLQPVPDNTNPNFIRIGNPSLLPNYVHELTLNYYNYSPIKQKNTYAGINYYLRENDFSSSVVYDSIGRTLTQPVNVSGNSWFSLYGRTEYKFLKKLLSLEPNVNMSISRNTNFINGQENITRNRRLSAGLDLTVETDLLQATIGGSIIANRTSTTLNNASNRPYGGSVYSLELESEAIKKWTLRTNMTYTENTNRAPGYNLNYLIWNFSAGRKFLAKQNLLLGIDAYDLLNQNINATRNIDANTIEDSKTNIVARYFLLRVTYRFDSNKEKLEQNDELF